jgi:hypothetical protein
MHLEMNETLSLLLPRSGNDKLVCAFVEAGVAFLIVGGVAVAAHGCRDIADVDDLDLLVEPTVKNGQRLLAALAVAQVPTCITADAIARPALQIPIKTHYYAELLTPRNGFDFAAMASRSVPVLFGDLAVNVVSMTDLIRMKEDAIAESPGVLGKHGIDLARLQDA